MLPAAFRKVTIDLGVNLGENLVHRINLSGACMLKALLMGPVASESR